MPENHHPDGSSGSTFTMVEPEKMVHLISPIWYSFSKVKPFTIAFLLLAILQLCTNQPPPAILQFPSSSSSS